MDDQDPPQLLPYLEGILVGLMIGFILFWRGQ